MQDEESWARELQLRTVYQGCSSDVVIVKMAATLRAAVNFESHVPIEFCPNLLDSVRLQTTAELLNDYPFALIMPMVRCASVISLS